MARIAIEMPKLGYDMETGVISEWLKKVGDTVSRGEAIAEIETEKATVEMEATASGRSWSRPWLRARRSRSGPSSATWRTTTSPTGAGTRSR